MTAPCSSCGWVGCALDGLCPLCLAATPPAHGCDDASREPCTPEPPQGYDLGAQLGRGGMGVVYRARQHNPPREVALKKLLAGEHATLEERRRFVTEIESAARVRHPNIVEIYAVSRPDEPPYFTMPLFPSTLRAELRRGQYRSPRAAATLMRTIARAVQHAHKRGVLHRDLKPDNILIDERGQPHVADFGLAKQVGDATLTAAGLGTPPYAAPEQLRNDRDAITTAVDQYSLGVMLYELLTGEPPFPSNGDLLAHLRAICETEASPPRARVRNLSSDLDAICVRSIARTPQERYETVGAFADDLDRFLRGEPTVARPPGVIGRGRRFLWHHRIAAGLGGGALVLLTVIAVATLNLAREQEQQLSKSTRDGYTYTAQAIASLVAQRLHRQQDHVVKLAEALDSEDLRGFAEASRKPELVSKLEGILAPHLRGSYEDKRDGFDDIWLFDQSGTLLVQLPLPDRNHGDKRGEDYWWRDYFQGARCIAIKHDSTPAYVARPLRAEITGTYKYGISVPIRDGHGWEGVLMVAKDTTSSEFQLNDRLARSENPAEDSNDPESSNDPETSIVAPCDITRPEDKRHRELDCNHLDPGEGRGQAADPPKLTKPDYCTVMHRRLKGGESPYDHAPELSGTMPSSTDHYKDPIGTGGVPADEFAAFTAVEGTSFRVIVHHPPTRVISLAREMPRRLVLPVIVALAAWGMIFGLGQRRIARRRGKLVVIPVRTPQPVPSFAASTISNK